jgi:hypothetical protein
MDAEKPCRGHSAILHFAPSVGFNRRAVRAFGPEQTGSRARDAIPDRNHLT